MNIEQYKWLFFDLNSYFASVEQQERPELRGKPVAIVPMETDYTMAIAASYEAKAYGVKTGTRILDAKRLCPSLRCVLARHDVYVRYHHKIVAEVVRHVPINKICSVDELSSRLPPRLRNRDEAIAVAHRIKQGLKENIGHSIKCSIGIAPNSFLAKTGTNMQKPDGLVVLDHSVLPQRLFELALTDLTGISTRMEERLHQAGIRSVEQFYSLSPNQARRVWGSVLGERMWYRLHGYDVEDPPTKKRGIGHSRILEPALRPPDQAWLMARKLTVKAASRLRREQFYSTSFDLTVTNPDSGAAWSGEMRTAPLQDNFALLDTLGSLWAAMKDEFRPRRLLMVAVNLHGLCRQEEITPDLFNLTSPLYQYVQTRRDSLTSAMDKINQRFGADTVQLGVVPETQAGYVGTKISYTRIPDLAEFLE
ncbi:MAG: Y-family DNA polymerase [Micavibrio sp.]